MTPFLNRLGRGGGLKLKKLSIECRRFSVQPPNIRRLFAADVCPAIAQTLAAAPELQAFGFHPFKVHSRADLAGLDPDWNAMWSAIEEHDSICALDLGWTVTGEQMAWLVALLQDKPNISELEIERLDNLSSLCTIVSALVDNQLPLQHLGGTERERPLHPKRIL